MAFLRKPFFRSTSQSTKYFATLRCTAVRRPAVIGCEAKENRVLFRFADDGSPYDPTSKVDLDVSLSVEEREIGGLGILYGRKDYG